VIRGVLDDRARGVYQGKVRVAEDAQKTDGQQMSRALLLSRKAEVDAKPELEIYA
jgi:Fe-S cluster assembly protein SufD